MIDLQLSAAPELPPHSVESEENLLGALLMDPGQLPDLVADGLQPDDFYIERHGWIYDAMLTLFREGWGIDPHTVGATLATRQDPTHKHRNRLDAIGGPAYLTYLPSNVPTALHGWVYGKIVTRAALRRNLLRVGGQLAELAYSEEQALDTIFPAAETLLAEVVARWQPSGVSATPVGNTLKAMWDGNFLGPRVGTGLAKLDARIHKGWRGGRLHIVAGRPGMGKTLTLLFSARHAVKEEKKRVLVATYEMTKEECINRLICMETGLDYDTVADEMDLLASEKKNAAIKTAITTIYDWPLYFVEEEANTPQKLRWAIQDTKADIVFIDRVGLMETAHSSTDRGGNRDRLRINDISRNLKQYTNATKIPIILAAQLNRDCEKRNDKRPLQSDLKDSGNLEQDADVVIMLYRHSEYYDLGNGFVELLVRKSRNGRPGQVLAKVDLSAMRLADTTQADINMYREEISE